MTPEISNEPTPEISNEPTHFGEFASSLEQENLAAPSMTPDPIPQDVDPVEFLIYRVQGVIAEAVQMGTEPLSTKASVLAQLYQAQAMRQLVDIGIDIKHLLFKLLMAQDEPVNANKLAEGAPGPALETIENLNRKIFLATSIDEQLFRQAEALAHLYQDRSSVERDRPVNEPLNSNNLAEDRLDRITAIVEEKLQP